MAYVDIYKVQDVAIKRVIDSGDPTTVALYVPLADRAIESLAQRRGIYTFTDISVDDDGYVTNVELEEYWINYLCMRMCRDAVGSNNVDIRTQEIYMVKLGDYTKAVNTGKKEITREMIIDEIDEIGDTVMQSSLMFRN